MKICYNCFHTANDSFRFCEKCGSPLDYQNSAACPDALECGTTLYGRYLIGNVLQQDDSSITYAAQDSRTKGRVAVREYFPRAYSSRSSMCTVSVSEEYRDEYLEGKDLFLQNAETLADETDSDQPPCVQSYFNQNDTAYLVVDYGSPDHLKEFLDGKKFQVPGAGPARDSAGRPSSAVSPVASHVASSAVSPVASSTASPVASSAVSSEASPTGKSTPPASTAAATDPSLSPDAVQKTSLPEDRPGSPGGYYPGTLPGESINVPHRNPGRDPALNPENARPQDPAPNGLWHDVPGSLPGGIPGSTGYGPGGSSGAGPGSSPNFSADGGRGAGPGGSSGRGPDAGKSTSAGSGAGSGRKNSFLPIAFILGILALCLVVIMLLIPRIARGSRDFRYFIYSIQRQWLERRSSKPDDSSDGSGSGSGSGIEDIFDGNGSENDGTKKDSPIKNPFEDLLKDDSSSDEESAKGISSGNYYNKGYYALLGDECFFADSRGLYRSSYDDIGNAEKVASEPATYLNLYGGRIYYLNDLDNKIRCFDPDSKATYDIYDYEGEQGFKPESVCINGDWCYFSCKNRLYRFSMEDVSSQSSLHSQDVETVLEDFNAENHIFPSLCFVEGSMVYNGQEGTVAVDPDGNRKTLSPRKGRLFSSGSDLYFKYGINEIYRLGLDGSSTQIINAQSGSFITTAGCTGGWIYYSLETEDNIELWRLSSDGDQNEYIGDLGSKGDILISLCVFKAPDEDVAGDKSAYAYVYLLPKTDSRMTPIHKTFSVE